MLIGVLGGGQLGQMLGQAGISLGARFRFFDPVADGPASAVGEYVHAPWDDQDALARFCDGLDACTFEFENVPAATLEFCADRVPTFPNVKSLTTGQDRAREKEIFAAIGFDVPPYRLIENEADLLAACDAIGVPAVLKARCGGYDGKGQALIRVRDEAAPGWRSIGQCGAILETFVPFSRELSIIASRDAFGAVVTYPLVENTHTSGILALSLAPTDVSAELQQFAQARADQLLRHLDYCGTLAIEMFEVQTPRGLRLIPNEFAPRVHNSGHWTIEGASASQFENHIRAVMGLPLLVPRMRGFAAMVNLIGSHRPLEQLVAIPDAGIHLYGKDPRAGRKLGHVTLVTQTADERASRLPALRKMAAP